MDRPVPSLSLPYVIPPSPSRRIALGAGLGSILFLTGASGLYGILHGRDPAWAFIAMVPALLTVWWWADGRLATRVTVGARSIVWERGSRRKEVEHKAIERYDSTGWVGAIRVRAHGQWSLVFVRSTPWSPAEWEGILDRLRRPR